MRRKDNPGNKTFVRITNQKIYDKVEVIESYVKKTDGKVGLNRKWLYGLSMVVMALLSWALSTKIGG